MTKELKQLCRQIEQVIKAPVFNRTTFEQLLAEIHALREPASIDCALAAFRDGFPYPEIMFSFIHLAESFEANIYVPRFLDALAKENNYSRDWTDMMLVRLLNSDVHSERLAQHMKSLGGSESERIRKRLQDIERQPDRSHKIKSFRQKFPDTAI